MSDTTKTPLQHALATLVAEDDHKKFLRLFHAGVQTCMSRNAVTSGKSDSELAADSRCYGRMLIEIEGMLQETPNPFATPRQQTAPKTNVPVSPQEFERLKKEMGQTSTINTV